ncbi:HlyD family secretion protein [Maribius pontilimi]|uniref:HlyD family secretion protein n=1 Tax=Palleronia pontilimi TaxID=1964209 RepID=A0A934IJN8_9RHOB|nr:HlyD family secretion protein [Palleronia pontilimi]MBJ3763790.1 HlyD family secretion protein [Palleronia pontilimi]
MRFGKLLLGSTIVVVSLWVIIGEQISGVSSDAVVNARLSTVRATQAGTLDMPFRAFGSHIGAEEQIGTLSATLPQMTRADDLRMERAFAAADLQRLVTIRNAQKISSAMPFAVASNDPSTGLELDEDPASVADADMTRAEQRLAALDQRIATETARLGAQTSQPLNAPVEGVLWEVLADHGEHVERGQDIAKLMMCGSALVTLSVPDNIYARLSVGQSARFRLNGSKTVLDGTITRMAGSGAETIYRNLVVAPSEKHLERFDVALLVPGLRNDPALRCSAGQTGRVFFDSRPLDWVRSFLN